MALERQSIEKKDFPIGRRGYDPEAVDSHLRALADEVDELKRSSRRRTETLASTASEQVRSIVEAAESSAANIQRQAEQEAQEIRAEANTEAQSTREQATEQAKEYVTNVSGSTSSMLQRIDAMESELGALIESLRTGSNRLNADLQLLEGNLTEVRDSVTPRARFEHEREGAGLAGAGSGATTVSDEELLEDQAAAEETEALTMPEEAAVSESGVTETPGAGAEAASDDAEGARLIALNMALNGTPREETDRYLAENFQLSNRDSLLDEVYASVEG